GFYPDILSICSIDRAIFIPDIFEIQQFVRTPNPVFFGILLINRVGHPQAQLERIANPKDLPKRKWAWGCHLGMTFLTIRLLMTKIISNIVRMQTKGSS
ncbi:hypothetical protein, partial [Kallipyga massiliensis]|uniref:hypothetical protein n=1 Tax=Kallipyga massiliensis TaxID=1472764 RepID=UPI0026F1CDF1